MSTSDPTPPVSQAVLWTGRVLSVLPCLLLTGYLGGAVATHVTHGELWVAPVIFGAILWLGLLLRDRKLQAIFPWRKSGHN